MSSPVRGGIGVGRVGVNLSGTPSLATVNFPKQCQSIAFADPATVEVDLRCERTVRCNPGSGLAPETRVIPRRSSEQQCLSPSLLLLDQFSTACLFTLRLTDFGSGFVRSCRIAPYRVCRARAPRCRGLPWTF